MEWWSKVLPAIAADASYFVYNRPGYGGSATTSTRRDGAHIVEELRAALLSEGRRPRYVALPTFSGKPVFVLSAVRGDKQ